MNMKKIIQYSGLVFGLSMAFQTKAQPVAYYDVSAFLGADYYLVSMKPKADWNQIFPKGYQGASFYVGTQFHENFAVELGYDWSVKQTKDWALLQGQNFFTSIVNASFSGTTRIRRSGGHFDFIGLLPVGDCTDVTFSAGIGWIEPKIEIVNMSIAPNGAMPNTSAIASLSGNGRGTFRLGLGVRYLITSIIGIRAKIGWESTSTLVVKGNAYFPHLGYQQKAFQGTTALSLGAFILF